MTFHNTGLQTACGDPGLQTLGCVTSTYDTVDGEPGWGTSDTARLVLGRLTLFVVPLVRVHFTLLMVTLVQVHLTLLVVTLVRVHLTLLLLCSQ